MRLVIINNHAWAVGMHWSRMQLQKVSRAKLVQKARKLNPNYDLMVVRHGQHGFGSSEGKPELWVKARSLAAFIQLPATSIIGLFALQDTMSETFWWVFARENGRNIGLGDQVFTSQSQAEEEIRSLQELLGDTAPDSIACTTHEASLEWLSPFTSVSLVATVRRRGCLESIDRPRSSPLRTWAIAVGLCCAVGYGANFWLDYQAEQRAQEEKLMRKNQQEARKHALQADPAQHFTQTWLQLPLADQVAALCVGKMRELPTVANGWVLDAVSCEKGRKLQISWKHEGQADYVALPLEARLESPKVAVSRLPLNLVTRTPRLFQDHGRLLTKEMGRRRLSHLCQMTGTKLRLSFKNPEKRSIDKIEVVAPWAQGAWELLEIPGFLLEEPALAQLLAELPGLTLESVSMNNDEWSFKGHIYVKPK